MANYIERTSIKGVKVEQQSDISIKKLRDNFLNMLDNVSNMLQTEGPILSTWIKFQIGLNKPIIFDTSSTNPNKNLIAQLEFNKKGAGVTNDFTITIQYDPFNYGQEDTDVIEKLDNYIADAMSFDFDTDITNLRGKIQYGYNAASDSSLVSPEYTFYLTDANTTVRFESGLSTYVFKGCSTLAANCDNSIKFPAVTADNIKLLDIVISVLYKYYGNTTTRPSVGTILSDYETSDEQLSQNDGYSIIVSEDCYNNCEDNIKVGAKSGMTPWEYCMQLLDEYPLTIAEKEEKDENGEYIYGNLAKLSYAQRPRYVMSINDAAKTIEITHVVPKYTNENKTKLEASDKDLQTNYVFKWGKSNAKNLVIGWKPEVDTKLYLIRRARYKNAEHLLNDPEKLQQIINNANDGISTDDATKSLINELVYVNDDLNEMFDAQLQIIGIPADPPIGLELGVQPTIMQTVSRTSGIYMVNGATDIISSNGMYITTLKMFRLRGMDDAVKELNLTAQQVAEKAIKDLQATFKSTNTNNKNNNDINYGLDLGRWRWPVVVFKGVILNGNSK